MFITEYKIRKVNEHTINEDISDLSHLSDILVEEGRSAIAKISFYFHDPDSYMKLLLVKNADDMFVPEYRTEDTNIQETQLKLVLDALHFRNLDGQFLPYIVQ